MAPADTRPNALDETATIATPVGRIILTVEDDAYPVSPWLAVDQDPAWILVQLRAKII